MEPDRYQQAHAPIMKRYELVDHTADMMVKAYGSSLEECFANAAFALFDQTVDLSTVEAKEQTRTDCSPSCRSSSTSRTQTT